MLWRGGAPAGVVGSSNELCAVNRARPSFAESNTLKTSARRVASREIKPAVIRVVADAIGLAHAVRIATLGADQVLRSEAAGVGDGEGIGLDRLIRRAPHLDDREAPLQQGFGFVGQQIAHALRPGPFGVVVVHVEHGLLTSFASRSASSPERSVWSKTTTREAPETFFISASTSGSRRTSAPRDRRSRGLASGDRTNSKPVTSRSNSSSRAGRRGSSFAALHVRPRRGGDVVGPKVSLTGFTPVDGVMKTGGHRTGSVSGRRSVMVSPHSAVTPVRFIMPP